MKNLLALLLLVGCDDATMVAANNGYTDGTQIDDVWWSQTYIPDVVSSGGESPAYRTVPGSDYAYAVIERDGDLIVLRSKTTLAAERGTTLHVTVSVDTFDGDCAAGSTIPQAVADLVTQSIFPAPFEGAIYDSSTCKTARVSGPDGGAD